LKKLILGGVAILLVLSVLLAGCAQKSEDPYYDFYGLMPFDHEAEITLSPDGQIFSIRYEKDMRTPEVTWWHIGFKHDRSFMGIWEKNGEIQKLWLQDKEHNIEMQVYVFPSLTPPNKYILGNLKVKLERGKLPLSFKTASLLGSGPIIRCFPENDGSTLLYGWANFMLPPNVTDSFLAEANHILSQLR
jgi:hypothetical protein